MGDTVLGDLLIKRANLYLYISMNVDSLDQLRQPMIDLIHMRMGELEEPYPYCIPCDSIEREYHAHLTKIILRIAGWNSELVTVSQQITKRRKALRMPKLSRNM